MYYLFIILSLLFKYNLCQNNLINSKFILDDFQPFASSFEERPVWNYESIDGKEEDAIIQPEELEENSDDELKNSNKQSIRALNNNENNDEQIQIEQPNLHNLFEIDDNEYINQYRSLGNGDTIESNIESNPFELLLQQKSKKNPRETRPYMPRGLRNSYVNFIKDDEFDDFDGNYRNELKLNELNKQLSNQLINKTNEKIMKLNNDNKDNKINVNKLGDRKINRKNKFYDENDYEDKLKEKDNDDKINYENFENLSFKLDDDEDDRKMNDKKLNNQNNNENNEKNKSYQSLLTKDIIPIPKQPKLDLISKVVYTDDQKTGNKKHEMENSNLKTNANLKEKSIQPTEYIDQPSLEPRIKKLRKIRRLRKHRFNQQPVDIKERIKNDLDKNLKVIKSENFTDNKLSNDKIATDEELNKLDKESDKFIKQNSNQSKPIRFDKTIHINDSDPNDNKKSNRIIRVVKVVKTNPLTKEIEESNVTVINKTLIKNESKNNQSIKEKSEPKADLNKTNKLDTKIKPTKNDKLSNYSNVDDYIDEFEDVESKKSKIKRVLYLN